MVKLNVSKELIDKIADQQNDKYLKSTHNLICKIMGETLKDLSSKTSFVSMDNVVFQPANELVSGAFIDGSVFTYLLGVQNVQLEINTSRSASFWKNLKDRLTFAWENRKTFIRKKKHKKIKKDKNKELGINEEKFKIDPLKYTINDLAEDAQKTIINYLSETSLVYLNKNLLQIIGKDDFGSNTQIFIYVVNYDGVYFKQFAGKKKGFINIDIDSRIDSLTKKIDEVGDNFIKILKIFNSLYFNTNGNMCNQVFLESILCSCPGDLFEGDEIYKVFLKLINHISIISLKTIKSINNPNLTIFKDEVCGNCILNFNKMLSRVLSK